MLSKWGICFFPTHNCYYIKYLVIATA